jgi:hypothetical protein
MNAASSPSATHRVPNSTVVAGTILFVVTLLEILAMAHHPSVDTVEIGQAIRRIGELSRLSELVHGALIALMLLTLYGLTEFALRRGFSRPLVRGGAIAYGCGTIVMLGAALVSGFVIGDIASLLPQNTPTDLRIDHQILILCGVLNQACARFGVVAMSVGIGLWSVDLLRDRGTARTIGVLGCIVAIVPVIGLSSGAIHLDVHGMRTVVLIQTAWNLAIAAWLVRLGR